MLPSLNKVIPRNVAQREVIFQVQLRIESLILYWHSAFLQLPMAWRTGHYSLFFQPPRAIWK